MEDCLTSHQSIDSAIGMAQSHSYPLLAVQIQIKIGCFQWQSFAILWRETTVAKCFFFFVSISFSVSPRPIKMNGVKNADGSGTSINRSHRAKQKRFYFYSLVHQPHKIRPKAKIQTLTNALALSFFLCIMQSAFDALECIVFYIHSINVRYD